jgi:lysozyme family protein
VRPFDIAFRHVLEVEGGYVNDVVDRGGATRYGVTEKVARAHGYTGNMEDLPLDLARDIYKAQYWDTLRLDEVALLSYPVAAEMFDTGVNCGVGVAGKFLQRALNALNHAGSSFGDLVVDGLIGPVSVASLRVYMGLRGKDGERVLLRALNGLQLVRYLEIAERDQAQERFVFGWIRNRVVM